MVLKIVWGTIIGVIAWVMITFASLDGIRMMNSLGGLPAMFIIIISNISLFVLLKRVLKGDKLDPKTDPT
jgi:glycine betaine transporter